MGEQSSKPTLAAEPARTCVDLGDRVGLRNVGERILSIKGELPKGTQGLGGQVARYQAELRLVDEQTRRDEAINLQLQA